ncbi:cytochrome P450 [Nocardia sp. NPDC049149]|uniref:cytochrome P450 n=1 Tax=Nocardia sp. NPDC049149 TaxID=3364315 RepID=UPI0037112530
MNALSIACHLARDPLAGLTELSARGAVVPIGLRPWQAFVVCDPELTRRVLVDDRTYDKGGALAARARMVAGNGLVTCSHADHRGQRRQLNPAFSRELVSGYADVVAEQVAAVTRTWRHGETVDAVAVMHTLTARITCATMFATELPADQLAQITRDLDVFMSGTYRRILVPRLLDSLPTPGQRRYHRAMARLRALGTGSVLAADRSTIHAVLTEVRDENGVALSPTELSDQVVTLFIAAVDTTAVALAWAIHLLASHPDIAERVGRESDTVLADHAATAADLPALELTRRVVVETLRLYPPLWFLTRVATTDTELGGHRIRAGSTVVCSPYLIHHRGDLHAAPERFDPDRHLAQPPRDALVPFGAGARRCIGDQLATAEATLALATLARRWRFEQVTEEQVRIAPRFVLAPRRLRVRLVARRPQTVSSETSYVA